MGTNSGETVTHWYTDLHIVPSGSKYKVEKGAQSGGVNLTLWKEARMPVAVGTGGKTVAFRGNLSAGQTLTSGSWLKVNLDTSEFDTDSALTDGKFQPSVSGYYQVNGSVRTSASLMVQSGIYKNGVAEARGNNVNTLPDDRNYLSVVSDIVYLNGTTDYLELFGQVTSTGTCGILSDSSVTYLSAVLVSGGSGDSIWTEEDGVATYDGDVATTGTFTASGTINTGVSVNCSGVNLGGSSVTGTGMGYSEANDSLIYNANTGNRWLIDGSTSMILEKEEGADATLRVPGLSTAVSTASPNICVNSSGVLQRTTGSGNTLDIDALPALPTAIEGTDLFVTERTGTNYKVSADELKG